VQSFLSVSSVTSEPAKRKGVGASTWKLAEKPPSESVSKASPPFRTVLTIARPEVSIALTGVTGNGGPVGVMMVETSCPRASEVCPPLLRVGGLRVSPKLKKSVPDLSRDRVLSGGRLWSVNICAESVVTVTLGPAACAGAVATAMISLATSAAIVRRDKTNPPSAA
jgi:hypothetical protein